MSCTSWEPRISWESTSEVFRILPRSGRIAWVFRSRACFAEPPAEWRPRELRFARYLADDLLRDDAPRTLADPEVEELLYRLAVHLGVVYREATRYLALEDGRLTVRAGAERRIHELPRDLATFRRGSERPCEDDRSPITSSIGRVRKGAGRIFSWQ